MPTVSKYECDNCGGAHACFLATLFHHKPVSCPFTHSGDEDTDAKWKLVGHKKIGWSE